MTYDELKTKITEAIKPNGNQEITAQVLQDVLLEIVEAGDVTLSVITTSIEPTLNGVIGVAREAKELAEAVDAKMPTKVSQLTNDADFATTAQVQKKGDWVTLSPIVSNGESVKVLSIRANTFTEVYDVVSSITVKKMGGDQMDGMNVLEASTYALQFTTADTVGDFVFPEVWKFPEEVVIEPNTTYQVSVVNNLAVIVGWPN